MRGRCIAEAGALHATEWGTEGRGGGMDTCQTRTVWSQDPDAIVSASADSATLQTIPEVRSVGR